MEQPIILQASYVDTPLGQMLAIADERVLYFLEFIDQRGWEKTCALMKRKTGSTVILGESFPIFSIKNELKKYFHGELKVFTTPLCCLGSSFQREVWAGLQTILLGETRSYLDLARSLGRPTSCRAIAKANSTNQIAIVIPCHRVIYADGSLGGYAGGVARKQWLIDHERTLR